MGFQKKLHTIRLIDGIQDTGYVDVLGLSHSGQRLVGTILNKAMYFRFPQTAGFFFLRTSVHLIKQICLLVLDNAF
jgi:hypothetical protein